MIYAAFVYYPKWKLPRTEATISWDVSGYYLYLPAFFIYHDLKNLDFKPGLDEQYYPSSSPYQSYTHTSGHQVMKYTCGLAILYAPFFYWLIYWHCCSDGLLMAIRLFINFLFL